MASPHGPSLPRPSPNRGSGILYLLILQLRATNLVFHHCFSSGRPLSITPRGSEGFFKPQVELSKSPSTLWNISGLCEGAEQSPQELQRSLAQCCNIFVLMHFSLIGIPCLSKQPHQLQPVQILLDLNTKHLPPS